MVKLVSGALASGKWAITKADVVSELQKAEDFWKSYKDSLAEMKAKNEYKLDGDTKKTVADAKKLADMLVKDLKNLKDAEKTIKAVRVKDLDVKEEAMDPTTLIRRVTRLIAITTISEAKALSSVNAILANVKKDDGND